MGWTGKNISRGFSYADEKALIQDVLSWPGGGEFTASLLQLSRQGSVWYAAVQFLPADPGHFADHAYYVADPIDGSITWAAVILTSRSGYDFMYKDLEESMGPYKCSAPASLINKLSPLKDGTTGAADIIRAWRGSALAQQVLQKKVRGLKDGDVINLKDAARFPCFGNLSVFKKVSGVGASIYRGYRSVNDVAEGLSVGFCRLTSRDLMGYGFEKISPASVPVNG